MSDSPLTYKDAGVDIAKGDEAIARIAGAAKKTHGPGVLTSLGGFAGLFSLKDAGVSLEDPVLVAGTDGVGTKLLVAKDAQRHQGIGQDLVAMCVNDILTLGARPLFFLDYFASGVLDPAQMAAVVTSVARACEACSCALIGGETAELPGLYAPGDYDLAGFATGVVERDAIIDGKKVAIGDAIIGLPSSGLHANGFSLARKIIFERMRLHARDRMPGRDEDFAGKSVAEVLLEPTRLYVKPILEVLAAGLPVHAMAHITGGGLPGNLIRPYPAGLGARLDRERWQEPAIFFVLRTEGPVDDNEMLRAFNCGIGFTLTVPAVAVDQALTFLQKAGEQPTVIGEVIASDRVEFSQEGQV